MATPRPTIERLKLRGYKSIREADIPLAKLNILIGANGSGKSNLISYFALLRATLNAKLNDYVGRHGGANALLHLGSKATSEIATEITMNTAAGQGTLFQRLGFRAPDSLFYSSDHADRPKGSDRSDEVVVDGLCALVKHGQQEGHPGQLIYSSLKDRTGIYHFHDTTLTAPIRSACYIEDNKQLHGDGGNLPAMLYLYQKTAPMVYQRIVRTIRKVMPQFDDFALQPQRLNPKNILLNWKQKGSDYLLGPHQLSDGSLRSMALCALFLQPEADLPDLILLDEPELGLHPYALEIVAGLIRSASLRTQVVVATQSQAFLEHFDASEIIVADCIDGASQYRRLEPEPLKEWLQDYTIGELWERNVLGGGPLP